MDLQYPVGRATEVFFPDSTLQDAASIFDGGNQAKKLFRQQHLQFHP